MNDDYRSQMYPDTDHVRKFGDDINTFNDAPSRRARSGRPGLLSEVRPQAVWWAIASAFALAFGIAVLNSCRVAKPSCALDANGHVVNEPCEITAETRAQETSFQAAVKAKQMKLLREQHKDFSKSMRDYRMP